MRLVLTLSILAFVTQTQSLSAQQPQLPAHVQQVRSWLPADTETLVVATNAGKAHDPSLYSLGRLLVRQPILEPLDELVDDLAIDWGIHAGRNFRTASAFGTQVQEGVSVVRYTQPLTANLLSQIHEALSKDPQSKKTKIGDHDVYVFPISKQGREGWAKEQDWEGRFVVLLDEHTIIKASSDRYLDECLARIKQKPTTMALPDDLPEWKYLDPKADVWLLRHVPRKNGNLRLQGLVWMAGGGRPFRVVYVPNKGASVREIAERSWIDQKTREIPADLLPLLSFAEAEDGVLTFTLGGNKPGLDEEQVEQVKERLKDSALVGKLGGFMMFFPYTSQGLTE